MGAGDLLVRIGAIVFLVGAVGTVATVAPLLLHTRRLPTPAYFVSMLMGLGLAIALAGLLRAAMAQRTPSATRNGADGTDRAAGRGDGADGTDAGVGTDGTDAGVGTDSSSRSAAATAPAAAQAAAEL